MIGPRGCSVLLLAGLVSACQSDGGGGDDFGFGPTPTSTSGASGGSGDEEGSADGDSTGTGGTASEGSGEEGPGDDGVGTEPDTPHARGTIVVGETHGIGGSISTPSVTATFVPDYQAPQQCGQMVAGCFVSGVPNCSGVCTVDEACGFSATCQSECQPLCNLACGVDQVCYFPAVGSPPACKALETFDAGPLAFSGTTVPVTLFPPYAYTGVPSGSLYLPGNPITVNGIGAVGAGFDEFERSYTATSYITTGLATVDPNVAYGEGAIPVTWQPAGDKVRVIADVTSELGNTGRISCLADEASGTFDVPRSAIIAPLAGDPLSVLSLTVERRRTEYLGGLGTHGTLTDAQVQADGWLELATTSSETVTVQNCGLLTWCVDACVDTTSNVMHCGGCGLPCTELQVCSASACL